MHTATLTETKNRLGALLARVRQGETILLLDRGHPVARLVPAMRDHQPSGSAAGRLERLERSGILCRAGSKVNRALLPARPRAKASVLDALLEERAEGR